ncbi:hypothetical protein CAOG_06787 [Capsaspora owczarzaki ATCC 30864]|uniref:hypothetical protein n=1 Tax=Capsaspora owczarzaki (strain ATCC 30864) TaxID=595528 RepID=UPI0001FE4611|nr:hypothetical protein CAOG_06787 [Capsaspora owczarzaki ATCC 30864]|eukprot:XP_004344408.1 hypothetical protein CAOG_06787 [Capsaspora owczarzaki ATCC 30864]
MPLALARWQLQSQLSGSPPIHGPKRNADGTLRTHYSVLGLRPTATQAEIKQRFYQLSKQLHPDVNKAEDSHMQFTELSEAYSVLSSYEMRQKYDRSLRLEQATWRPAASQQGGQHRKGQNSSAHDDSTSSTNPSSKGPAQGSQKYSSEDRARFKFNFEEHYRHHYGQETRGTTGDAQNQHWDPHVWENLYRETAKQNKRDAVEFAKLNKSPLLLVGAITIGCLLAAEAARSWLRYQRDKQDKVAS